MKLNRLTATLLVLLIFTGSAIAQKITYSEPEREDSRRTIFEIIGRIEGNILVYKNNRSDNDISVYDNDMKLLNRVKLDVLDDRIINVDFIPYNDFAWMIYQFQRKNIVHCVAVKINGEGKRLQDPIEIDTTRIGWAANNKIYTTIFSDDKQRVMVFKINSRNQKNFLFTTLLMDNEMKLLDRQELQMPMEERNDYFTDFLLDNEGGMVFGKYRRRGGSEYITDLKVVTKAPAESQFQIADLNTGDRILDEVRLKVDNTNNRYFFSALYYQQRRGNIEGLYTIVFDKKNRAVEKQIAAYFNDDLRRQAKGPDANLRLAFNDYFIKNMIIRKDGGYLLVGESMYTSSRGGSSFNRWDYLSWNNPWSSPFNSYYSPYGFGGWNSPWNRWGGRQSTRYIAENIMVLSFNKDGGIEWSNVIPKSQYDDETDALISHQMVNTGGELHFLFNTYERRTLLLSDQSIGPDGKITRYPTLKNLDRGFEFMPRFGKQIGSRTVIMPCQYRNYLTFAKIDL